MSDPHGILQTTADLREKTQTNLDSVGRNQHEVLSSTEKLAIGWFERRHAGIQSAFTAAQRMCGAKTPVDAISEYQAWAAGAVGRVIADGLAFQKYLTTVAGVAARPLSSHVDEGAPTAPNLRTKHKPSKAA
jgi:hypothetical protein